MRKNLNEFKLFDANVVDGTCVENIAINSKTNEVAYLKTTGCMLGVFNEDYNELIASDILKNIGFKAPKIELTTYNNENAWLSYNVLNENEYPFDLNFSNHGLKSEYHEHKFLEYINRIYDSCAQLGTERD